MNLLRNKFLLIGVGIVIIAAGAGIWVLHVKKPTAHSGSTAQNPTDSASQQNQRPNSSSSQDTTQNNSSTNTAKNPSPPSNSGQALTPPSGTFISNHHPSSITSQEQSTCNTVSGATCEITFTKDGITKNLGMKTADNTGAVYWTWTPQDIGLTSGDWHVTVTATLKEETKTAQDTLALTVP